MYVVARDTKIIYMLWVYLTNRQRDSYARAVQTAASICINQALINGLKNEQLGHAVDHHTVLLWHRLKTQLLDSGMSMTPAHELIPAAVSMWNHVKGGQDVASRQIKNVKVNFRKLHPRAYIWMHFVNVALLNAHLIVRILKQESELNHARTYLQWKSDLNKIASFESNFMIRIATEWSPSDARACLEQPEDAIPDDTIQTPAVIKKLRARKMIHWNQSDGKKIRLDKSVTHGHASITARSCVICRTPSDSASAQKKADFINQTPQMSAAFATLHFVSLCSATKAQRALTSSTVCRD